jgi:choline dehydrogenase-like flavoprotein
LKFSDFRETTANSLIETDLCIIGSGPAGLSIAKEFIGTNIQVLIVESGGLEEEPETQALYEIENIGAPRQMQQDLVRNRIFGGTSHTWTGRCTAFDAIDFQQRDWVPYSGWAIEQESLDPYLDRARANLGLGSNCYDESLWERFKVSPPRHPVNPTLLKSQFWQFSKVSNENREPMRFGRYLMPNNVLSSASNISVLLHANVTHLNTNQQGTRLESVEVTALGNKQAGNKQAGKEQAERKQACIKAKTVVLCCGAIENARLLLASNRILPNGVGNQNDMVGRFLMDHPGTVVGVFDPNRSYKVEDRFGLYSLNNEQGRSVYLHGLALSPELQAKEQLLNSAAFLMSAPADNDPWDAIKRLKNLLKHGKSAKPVYQDLLAILTQPWAVLQGLYRQLVKRRAPIIKSAFLFLYCLIEQLPDPESRVTLSKQKDALGMPLSKLNWKISQRELQTAKRLGECITQEFQRLGLPQPKLSDWLYAQENEQSDWQSNFTDRAHPTGTTRMTVNPKEGVVDVNCQVHGVSGLFVAGSSVFPTTGHANPTLMIVALSIRLADWLKANSFSSKAESSKADQEEQSILCAASLDRIKS